SQLLRGGVGVGLEAEQTALVVAGNALREVAIGHRRHHRADLVERHSHGVCEAVDTFAEVVHETVLALNVDAEREITDHRSLDNSRHFVLDGLLLRDVRQLDDKADASPLAHHRRDYELEVASADTVLRARNSHDILQAGTLTVRVLVNEEHALA